MIVTYCFNHIITINYNYQLIYGIDIWLLNINN